MINDKESIISRDCKQPYEAPEIVLKMELIVDLQTNVLPDEPPPPL
ncbi:MAG: hypothetical protein KAU06_09960 [Candidatus Marinimicrobia bacterium]|nr:hypothetical protein [Candidatus Neomarinimicrobiota bacterium]